MFIIRGVNIYPSHIDEILSQQQGIGSEYQIHLDRGEDGKDYMTIKVERARGSGPEQDMELSRRIGVDIRKSLLVRGIVEIVDHGSLPRTGSKSKRLFDNRD
jgi:phenylacetate-CoA ligase